MPQLKHHYGQEDFLEVTSEFDRGSASQHMYRHTQYNSSQKHPSHQSSRSPPATQTTVNASKSYFDRPRLILRQSPKKPTERFLIGKKHIYSQELLMKPKLNRMIFGAYDLR